MKDEFDAFLECGILAHGFLRLRCCDCGHDKLVAFSCKRRGFCPSCGARRMAQTAAHLVDQVVHRMITRHLLGQAGLKADEAESGAVTLIQRFGSAANVNIHLHCLVLDGVYQCGADGVPQFVEVPAPTDEALQAVLHKIITRTMKLLTRRGVLVEEEGSTYMADNDGDSDEAHVLRPLQAAACTYRIAFGPRAGQKVLTLQGAERGHGSAPAGGPVPREGLALASAGAASKACPGTGTSSKRCAPTTTGLVCRRPKQSWVLRTLCESLHPHMALTAARCPHPSTPRPSVACRA